MAPTLTIALLAFLALAIAATATRVLIAIAPRVGLIDDPSPEKFHRRPTPVGGGVAIVLALIPLAAVPLTQSGTTTLILAGTVLLALIGLADDLWGVSATVKFVALLGLTTTLWSVGLAAHTTRIPLLDLFITVLWVTAVSSSFNAIDNMDGVAGGITAIAAAGFLSIALQTQQWTLGGLSAALLGGSLGFLWFNVHPARIFMGDSGSFAVGFFLACLGVSGDWNHNELIAAIIPILLLGVPLFDLGFTVIARHRNGVTRTVLEAIRHCDTDHLAHRLSRLGVSSRGTAMVLYLLAVSFAISAVTLRHARPADGLLHLVQAGLIVGALIPVLRLSHTPPDAATSPAAGWRDLALLVTALGVISVGLYVLG